jgi:hypothetical protein
MGSRAEQPERKRQDRAYHHPRQHTLALPLDPKHDCPYVGCKRDGAAESQRPRREATQISRQRGGWGAEGLSLSLHPSCAIAPGKQSAVNLYSAPGNTLGAENARYRLSASHARHVSANLPLASSRLAQKPCDGRRGATTAPVSSTLRRAPRARRPARGLKNPVDVASSAVDDVVIVRPHPPDLRLLACLAKRSTCAVSFDGRRRPMAQNPRTIISTILAVLAFWWVALGTPTGAQTYYVAKTDSDDSNPCTAPLAPCKTIQGAVSKVPLGSFANIIVGAGVYDIGSAHGLDPLINILYYRFVAIFGECANRGNVVLRGNDANKAIIWAQDHVIAALGCMTITAAPNVSGVIGFATRQYAIGDCSRLRFGPMPGGYHLLANENSKINCDTTELAGGAAVHAYVNKQSNITFGALSAPSPVVFDTAIFQVAPFGILDAASLTVAGAIMGKSYICDFGFVSQPAGGLPGSAGDSLNGCQVRP